jgi:hypothetical protein
MVLLLFFRYKKINNLGLPIQDEWMPLTELKGTIKLDTTPLIGVKKLKSVSLYTEKGIIRAINSKTGVLLNKTDLKARGLID